jgi:PAS domain S-box-containing protein
MGDLCVVRLIDTDRQRLLPASVWHDDPVAREHAQRALAQEVQSQNLGLSRTVLETGKTLRVSDSPDAWTGVSPVHRSYVDQFGLRSIVLVPLQARGRTIGILSVSRESAGQPYTAEDQAFLEDLAHRAAVAIDNARLYDALQQSEERYRVVSELSSDYAYAFRISADGQIEREWTTAAFTRMTGYTPDELDERGWESLAHPDDREPLSTRLSALSDGQHDTRESRIVTRAGTIRWIEDQLQPVIGSDGRLIRVYGAAKDITEHKEVARLQREFLALVTHELKGPLTSLRGFAQLMRRREAYDPQGIETIINQSIHLERLINDLLDAVRVEAGHVNLRRDLVDLGALVRRCVEEVQATILTHRITVRTPDEPLEGFWDSDRIDQVVLNLLSNAIKYSPDNTDIEVIVDEDGDVARLIVSDHGVGIALDDIPHLFERFFRVETTRDYSQGIGLGLYITKSLVEAHGGTIGVASTPGAGSTFTIMLPRVVPADPNGAKRSSKTSEAVTD